MEKIKCSLVIPTKDKISRLRLTLKALEHQVDNTVEVIVVFDGCTNDTINVFDKLQFSFKPIKVICEQNIGRAAARNRGLGKAKGKVIIFLDDDRIPSHDFIEKHLKGHNEECVLLGERRDVNLREDEIEQLFCTDFSQQFSKLSSRAKKDYYNDVKKIFLRNPYHSLRYIAFITGNVSIDKSILDNVGGFDENYKGWGYEDTDLGYRIAKKNIKYKTDFSIINYHLMHKRSKAQKSQEELNNLKYISCKFKNDPVLQRVVKFYQLKARLLL